MFKVDPGPCPICGMAHTACTATPGGAPIVAGKITPATSVLVPQGGKIVPATTVVASQFSGGGAQQEPLEAERVQRTLPAGQFTTGTYRGNRKRGAPAK
ncbi:MAG: hypothetical protein ACREUZ_01550 [Burkholderiales bacterium]